MWLLLQTGRVIEEDYNTVSHQAPHTSPMRKTHDIHFKHSLFTNMKITAQLKECK